MRGITDEERATRVTRERDGEFRFERLRGFVDEEHVGTVERRRDGLTRRRERTKRHARATKHLAREFIDAIASTRASNDRRHRARAPVCARLDRFGRF